MDPSSEARLAQVCPALAEVYRQIADEMEAMGEPLEVIRGLASLAEQQKLYDQGRTTPGPIVTHAPPLDSWHVYGLAIDGCPKSLLPTKNWSPDSPLWVAYGRIAKKLGLFWGGDFVHVPPDRSHVQLTGSFPVSPNELAKQVLQNAGLHAGWVEAGLATS